jgi:hypothetical protein
MSGEELPTVKNFTQMLVVFPVQNFTEHRVVEKRAPLLAHGRRNYGGTIGGSSGIGRAPKLR